MIEIGYSGVKSDPYIVTKGDYLILSNGDRAYIPKGFLFDNASVPRIIKFLRDTFHIEFFKYKSLAFCFHDFVYTYRGYQISPRFLIRPISRTQADKEMVFLMDGYTDRQKKIFYLAVRFFGGWYWRT